MTRGSACNQIALVAVLATVFLLVMSTQGPVTMDTVGYALLFGVLAKVGIMRARKSLHRPD
jgi:hypothetical protein